MTMRLYCHFCIQKRITGSSTRQNRWPGLDTDSDLAPHRFPEPRGGAAAYRDRPAPRDGQLHSFAVSFAVLEPRDEGLG